MRYRINKKAFIVVLVVVFALLTTGAGVYLALQQQDNRSRASDPQGKILLEPSELTGKSVNDEVVISIMADPDSSQQGEAMAIDAILTFDPTKAEAISIEKGDPDGTYPLLETGGIDNQKGEVYVSWAAYKDGQVTAPIKIASLIGRVTFKLKSADPQTIRVSFATDQNLTTDSNIIEKKDTTAVDILKIVGNTNINGGGTCTPQCTGKECGSDGCGGSCGTCADGKTCNSSNLCTVPDEDEEDTDSPADIDEDGRVSISDYSLFVEDYLKCRDSQECEARSDLTGDEDISIADYNKFVEEFLAARD